MVVLLIGPGRGPSPGEGQHEARKVFWQAVAVQTSSELFPAQLCAPSTRQCSSPTFWPAPVAASRVLGGAHKRARAGGALPSELISVPSAR